MSKYGIALYPGDGADAESLLRNAEAALERAKATGERYLFYTQQMTEHVASRLALETELRSGLERDEFVMHYQPKVEVETRRIVGAEALIRWRSLSPLQLRHRDFVETTRALMAGQADRGARTGIDIEITEGMLMTDVDANVIKLNAIRDMGLNIAIDDFGTGYSSLSYLAKLPVQSLKIDRMFVASMVEDPDTMTLVSTMISLGHALRLRVVAEGVETEDQARMLRLLRCDEMQGFLVGHPVPAEEFRALLLARQG